MQTIHRDNEEFMNTTTQLATPPAIDPAGIAAPAREQLPTPESLPAPSAKLVEAANDASVMPPKAPELPTPPIHSEVTNDPHLIEKNIAQFIADRLPPEMRAGLMVDFEESPSNKITSEGQLNQGLHDVNIKFTGGKLDNPEVAQKLAEQLRAAMREHPAFEGMSFGGVDQPIEHMMNCQILGLEKERFNSLQQPQPRVHKTFLPEATPGAAQAEDGKITVDAKSIEQALAHYLGERLEESQKQGVNLKVEAIAQSNAVTARDTSTAQFDLLMKLEGGAHSTTRDHKIEQLLRHHPVLNKSNLEISRIDSNKPEGGQESHIVIRAMGLGAEQLVALIQAQPLQTGTPLSTTPTAAHTCMGAGCTHCTGQKEVAEAAAAPTHAEPAHAHHQTANHTGQPAHAPHVDHHAATHPQAAHPHGQEHAHAPHPAPQAMPAAAHIAPVASPAAHVAPATTVDTPALHQGLAAANDQQVQLAG